MDNSWGGFLFNTKHRIHFRRMGLSPEKCSDCWHFQHVQVICNKQLTLRKERWRFAPNILWIESIINFYDLQGDGVVTSRRPLRICPQPQRQWSSWGSSCAWSKVAFYHFEEVGLKLFPYSWWFVWCNCCFVMNYNNYMYILGELRLKSLAYVHD